MGWWWFAEAFIENSFHSLAAFQLRFAANERSLWINTSIIENIYVKFAIRALLGMCFFFRNKITVRGFRRRFQCWKKICIRNA